MLIFLPISQVGWANASAGLASAIRSDDQSRNGPPEAVKINLRGLGACWAIGWLAEESSRESAVVLAQFPRHWKIAECSLSTGSNSLPLLAIISRTSGPATTMVSLFAKATRLPALIAAKVLSRPALPTIAATTTSTSSEVAASINASGPTVNL